MMSTWINGTTRSGKTSRLVEGYCAWMAKWVATPRKPRISGGVPLRSSPPVLVLAANDDSKRELNEQLTIATQGKYPLTIKSPLGFFQEEVLLFFPLLIQSWAASQQFPQSPQSTPSPTFSPSPQLLSSPQPQQSPPQLPPPLFPLKLHPETEQELATRLWQHRLTPSVLRQAGTGEYQLVRRILDLMMLAGLSGVNLEDIPVMLHQGLAGEEDPALYPLYGELLQAWYDWCWQRGFLSYGMITQLYWRYLLPHPDYQRNLRQRTAAVFADDVDDYPAIACDLLELLLDRGVQGMFTYNPNGKVRLGLNADPDYLLGLASRCRVENLTGLVLGELGHSSGNVAETIVDLVSNPVFLPVLPPTLRGIQTVARSQMLRQTANTIIDLVRSGVEPREIAVIAPGLDAIARYTLTEILTAQGIGVYGLHTQNPLNSMAIVRGLLTLLALVYPGLGRLITGQQVAEMLVILSGRSPQPPATASNSEQFLEQSPAQSPTLSPGLTVSLANYPETTQPSTRETYDIDPVRAGLLVDHCFVPDPELPQLLPESSFSRWDRLGAKAVTAYNEIRQWIEEQRRQQQQRLAFSAIAVLDRAMQKFLFPRRHLNYEQLAGLRALMETAQHYWEVDQRVRQNQYQTSSPYQSLSQDYNPNQPQKNTYTDTIAQFIQMLDLGTVTANPYPVQRFTPKPPIVSPLPIFFNTVKTA
ncbi:MAG: recombinase family protein, partial [Coleofasciculaceae cyanobacterium SM2_1_6]|nr:recombinase family protein [Coleofasciculaceae cyanobacterium SM2_1_6]